MSKYPIPAEAKGTVRMIIELKQEDGQFILSPYSESVLRETLIMLQDHKTHLQLQDAIYRELEMRERARIQKRKTDSWMQNVFPGLWWALMAKYFGKGPYVGNEHRLEVDKLVAGIKM